MIQTPAEQTYALHQLADAMDKFDFVIQTEGKTKIKISCCDIELDKNMTEINASSLRILASEMWKKNKF